jgi:Tol biopolymer transport system component
MTDERIDALVRRLDVASTPDPAFVASTSAILRPLAREARVQDSSPLGRFRRDLRGAFAPTVRPSTSRSIAALLLVGLALLVALAAAILVLGANHPPSPIENGPLVVAVGGQVRAVDVAAGTSRVIARVGEGGVHVSRSPDGRLVAFWRPGSASDQLMAIGIEGQGIHTLAEQQSVKWAGCVDTWSPDSRYLASEVIVGGISRIMVADTVTGDGRLVTPEGVVAHCPLWSPEGKRIAFTLDTKPDSRTLAVLGVDGSGMRVISGDLGGFQVDKPDTWSPDGAWIYFGAVRSAAGQTSGRVYRSDVASGVSLQLSSDAAFASAPASSPDGTQVAFTVAEASGSIDLYVANSDGSQPRLLLARAVNDGWSADGRYVLTRWTPEGQPGGLVVISPDGTGLRVVGFVDPGCPADGNVACDFGWGQPRP